MTSQAADSQVAAQSHLLTEILDDSTELSTQLCINNTQVLTYQRDKPFYKIKPFYLCPQISQVEIIWKGARPLHTIYWPGSPGCRADPRRQGRWRIIWEVKFNYGQPKTDPIISRISMNFHWNFHPFHDVFGICHFVILLYDSGRYFSPNLPNGLPKTFHEPEWRNGSQAKTAIQLLQLLYSQLISATLATLLSATPATLLSATEFPRYVKTKVSCETSSKFQATSFQNERFARGLFQFSSNKLLKRAFCARLLNFT